MKITLYLASKIMHFSLPSDISGSYSFDENKEEPIKLINVEAKDGQWMIYSTDDVKVFFDNHIVNDAELRPDTFYILQRNEKNYLIYVSELLEHNIATYSYNQTSNFIIGNTPECNIHYSCEYVKDIVKISFVNNQYVLQRGNISVYINNKVLSTNNYYIKPGDLLHIYGMKILFLPNMLLMNNPGGKVLVDEISSKIGMYSLGALEEPQEIEVKEEELYTKDDYFSKSPRIRRIIETKTIKLSPPPKPEGNEELPLLLTIGPMFTMGVTSAVTLFNTIHKIQMKEVTIQDSMTSLVMGISMLVSMLLWPLLTKFYNKRMKIKKRKEVVKKYSKYLGEKKEELANEVKLQKGILLENLISTEKCLDIVKNKNFNFWDKRIDQNDFLVVRIGYGKELLDAKVEYPEEGFTIEEDDLRKQADQMVEEYKYIENVPVGYSFYENKITAIMGNSVKSTYFMNNIILQLITFYSYEDLKLVVFTTENKEESWDYVKYLNHNFNNDKSFRFFSSTLETSKNVAEYLNYEINNRLASIQGNKTSLFKPHYVIIIDDYNRVKKYDFIKTLSELDENLGFSIIILEDRLSNLPSKCSNFITLGEKTSGVLKNSYEKQEQIEFYDEINYTVNMMSIAKVVSNIPIEFEEGIKQLPEAITFLEMENVGKVEQLNILNRWNANDSTTSLKAEVGVDEQGELMYLDLHEKYHGPHGLVAGMTGSGKSEFIITYILSMAINYSPDDVAFILIDYKGGGLAFAFENKATGVLLPHLAGTITNLDKAEMDRTLVSIDSEIKRRQRIFNDARDALGESTIDIYKYQRFFHEGKLEEAVPHLFIICDEFAELKSQQPDFMDNLISVARIGRSLGVHLILATQKPSGVVNDQIWSNSKFRVCLKVQDESDSKEMLKRPDAASLKQTGRFYLQVGYDEYFALGQSAWCGAKYYPSDRIIKQVDKSINFINDNGDFIKSIQASNNTVKVEAQGEQLAAIMKSIIEIANKTGKKARKLWLDNVSEVIIVDELFEKYQVQSEPFSVQAIIGEYDAPEKQEQGLLTYSFLEDGNTAIYGTDSTESEMLLNTIIYSTIKKYHTEEVQYYIIDYGSQALRKFEKTPHVGGIVYAGEEEKYKNLFKMIREEIKKRKKLFADYGGEYKNFIRNSDKKLPLKVVVMNNFDAINESDKNLYDDFPEIIRDSERYGIIFIITATGINSIPRKISQNIENNYALKLKDPSDYASLFNARKKLVPRDMFGRGVYSCDGLHEFQTASLVANEDNLNDFILNLLPTLQKENPQVAEKIPMLPEQVVLSDVEQKISDITSVPIGINKNTLDIDTYDFTSFTGTVIGANKLKYTQEFMMSFIDVILKMDNTNLIVIDPSKLLGTKKEQIKNYYSDSLDKVIEAISNYLNQKIEAKNTQIEIIIIYGISKLLSQLDDNKKLEELMDLSKKCDKTAVIISDDAAKLKSYAFDPWYQKNFSPSDGIWIGNGAGEQNIVKISNYNAELTKDYKNNMGFHVSEGSYVTIKLLEFDRKEEETL